MQYSELRTATLRSVFAGVYATNAVVACLHFGAAYLDAVASLVIILLATCMLTITLQQPAQLMVYFETTGKEVVFTWRMRSVADVVQIVFLVAKGPLGEIMAIITSVFLFLAFSLAQKRPDIFRELFRKHAGDPEIGSELGEDGVMVEGEEGGGESSSGYRQAVEPMDQV